MLTAENQKWLDDVWGKIQAKMSAEVDRIGDKIPYIPKDGKYEDWSDDAHVGWWTNGFWPGMLWQMYTATGDERYMKAAQGVEKKLDKPLHDGDVSHDAGFMWLHSAVADYRITGSEESKKRGVHAANMLLGRYNADGKFIRAWEDWDPEHPHTGWVIIDCMMNVPLLYWASEVKNDPRFKQAGMHHADTAMEKIIRADGSSAHIVALNPDTGDVEGFPPCQGYAPEGAWSRGQAWAIYGFALSAMRTGKKEYLDTAKKVAHYFLANVAQTGNIPLVDFRQPAEPVVYDTTAATCAACGLLEIADQVPELEKSLYYNGAVNMLKATMARFCNWNVDEDGILGGGTVAYHNKPETEVPIIYGDYFMIEAILRLMGKDFKIW